MRFLSQLLRSEPRPNEIFGQMLLVPTPDAGEPSGQFVLEGDTEVSFVVVRADDGRLVLPAFTTEDALTRWAPQGSPYIALAGRILVEMLATSEWDRIVVDGADPRPLAMTKSAAQELLGLTRYAVPEGSQLRIGLPANPPPDGLVAALQRACSRHPAVAEAYLFQFQVVERDEPPHLAVGLRLDASTDSAEFGEVARRMLEEVEPRSWGYEFLDFIPLDDDLGESVRRSEVIVLRDRQ